MIKKFFYVSLAAARRFAEGGDRLALFILGWIFAGWVALLPHGAAIALGIGYAAFAALAFAAVRKHKEE